MTKTYDDTRRIEVDEYIEEYFPLGNWVLVEKDPMADKHGVLHIPDDVKKSRIKFTCTGVIKKMPNYSIFDDEQTRYRCHHLKVGDRVGFGASVPVLSPAPAHYYFEGFSDRDSNIVTLHICDLCAVLKSNEE